MENKWKTNGWEIDTTYENHPSRNINFAHNKDLIILDWSKKLKKMVELLEEEKKFIIHK
ncbi:hypothetical protein [Flavobacterium sp. GSB-24]|uniref:hypothetical protein n=1 Tax=Flavobacterium sp. GSB-24 TaxID=2994319 RepID=UPI00248F4C40|nr:hypothetical protein [Flavobacterium sp. GSB-24]BDU26909.1 hypothetical protein FLGSB24_36530 [Flavobacterium sp. GSB-24]